MIGSFPRIWERKWFYPRKAAKVLHQVFYDHLHYITPSFCITTRSPHMVFSLYITTQLLFTILLLEKAKSLHFNRKKWLKLTFLQQEGCSRLCLDNCITTLYWRLKRFILIAGIITILMYVRFGRKSKSLWSKLHTYFE